MNYANKCNIWLHGYRQLQSLEHRVFFPQIYMYAWYKNVSFASRGIPSVCRHKFHASASHEAQEKDTNGQ